MRNAKYSHHLRDLAVFAKLTGNLTRLIRPDLMVTAGHNVYNWFVNLFSFSLFPTNAAQGVRTSDAAPR